MGQGMTGQQILMMPGMQSLMKHMDEEEPHEEERERGADKPKE